MSLLRYVTNRIRYPKLRDYLDMGIGIESRYERCKKYWEPHLSLSKEFQRKCLQKGHSVAVLGSGRLYDVDVDYLSSRFQKISLFDADPLSGRKAIKLRNPKVEFHLADVTGTIEQWTRELEKFLKNRSGRDISSFLDALSVRDSILESVHFDAVISINLLSQIPFHWRDRAAPLIEKYTAYRRDDSDSFEGPIGEALFRSSRKLEEQHLALLAACGASNVILISDAEFCFYTSDQASWECYPAHQLTSIDLKGYRAAHRDSWFWHIAPQYIENRDYGSIHVVEAYHFSR